MSYVELYIDETGDPGNCEEPFTIGGVYVIYDDEDQARKFNHELYMNGVRYFYPGVELKEDDKNPLYDHQNILYPKEDQYNSSSKVRIKSPKNSKIDIDKFKIVLGKEKYKNILVRTIRLTYAHSMAEDADALAVNITMLKCLIELFLYEILPALNVDIEGISIFVATRVQSRPKDEAYKAILEEYKYGIGYIQIADEYRSYYISSQTPYLLMKEVEDMHANQRVVDSAEFRLLGVMIIYQKNNGHDNRHNCLWEYSSDSGTKGIYKNNDIKNLLHIDTNNEKERLIPLQRPMHYIADAMLSHPERFNNSTVGCMLETYDKEDLPKFINASRLLDQGKHLEALQEVIAIENRPSELETSQQGRKYILARLGKQAVPEISNEDFYHLVSTYKVQKAQQNKAQQGG